MSESQEMPSLWEDLLPGIHDDVTFTHIATRLPWTTFHHLSSVSRAWQRTIQSRAFYGERTRCQSKETLIVVKHRMPKRSSDRKGNWGISLYSIREKTFYELPPIPEFERHGISKYSQFISLDGKLYVLRPGPRYQSEWDNGGGIKYGNRPPKKRCRQTYHVLDLAAQKPWTICTSVPEPERKYSFSMACGFTVRQQHLVWGGCADWFRSWWNSCDAVEGEPWIDEERSASWRVAERFRVPVERDTVTYRQVKFRVEGKNYSLWTGHSSNHAIYLHEFNTKYCTLQHSASWDQVTIWSGSPVDIFPCFILPVNNELLALARWKMFCEYGHDPRYDCRHCDNYNLVCYDRGYCFIQTKGFGTESKNIVWEKVPDSENLHFDSDSSLNSICPIQL